MSQALSHSTTGAEHGADHAHSLRPYVYVFIALLVLLAGAVVVAYIPAGTDDYHLRFLLTTIAYTIAVVKAVLIILWFMHVKESSRLTWLFAGTSFFFILILIALTLNDYNTRGMVKEPYKQPLHSQYAPREHP